MIDLQALRHNCRYLKQVAGDNRLIAVVKADAYGHGSSEVAEALADDVDAFAVATVSEGLTLRYSGISKKILVLGGFTNETELRVCIEDGLDPVLHHQFHLDSLQADPDLRDMEAWIKIDSGMGRLGFSPERVRSIITFLSGFDTLGSLRLMTHLANADDMESDFTASQLDAIRPLQLDDFEWGIANSAGILGWPDAHSVWVRAGIALYGANPLSDRKVSKRELQPVMTMVSIVLAVNRHRSGDVIGYGNTYTCRRDMTIAVVATGYADGYPRHKSGTAQVMIHDELCDLVGRVSMDMITVDVSHLQNVGVGDNVTLFGASPEVSDLADCSQTIAYEILCNVGAHVWREYLE